MVFSTQALGLIVAPLIALALLGGGLSDGLAWRIMLGLGAVPAAAVLYLRRRLPESPRYQAQIQGRHGAAVDSLARFSEGRVMAVPSPAITHQMGLWSFLTNRRWLLTLAGTAGCWFLLDYAFYGNTISTPQIIGLISPHSSIMTTIAIQLVIFVVAAVPGYLLGTARMDRVTQIVAAGVAATLAAGIFGTVLPDLAHAHEVAILLPLGAVLAGRMLPGLLPDRWRRGAVRVAVPALGVWLACALAALCWAATWAPLAPQNQALASWLTEHHYTDGLAGYWQANSTTVTPMKLTVISLSI